MAINKTYLKVSNFVFPKIAALLHFLGGFAGVSTGLFSICVQKSDYLISTMFLALGFACYIAYINYLVFGRQFDKLFKKQLVEDDDIDDIFAAPRLMSVKTMMKTRACRAMLYSSCIILPWRTKTNPTLVLLFDGYNFRKNVNTFQACFAYLYGLFVATFVVLAGYLMLQATVLWAINFI